MSRGESPATGGRANRLVYALVAVWVLATGGAMAGVWRYKTRAASTAHEAPAGWPSDVTLPRAPHRPTIVMLAHPKCPCTRASIGELAELMTRVEGKADAFVLFAVPEGTPEGWERSDTWERAAAIPGVRVIADRKGAIAARFGATVSGHVVVYDSEDREVFQGGITSARGHYGESAGRARIAELVAHVASAEPGLARTPTFGCDLDDPSPPSEVP